MTTRGHLYSIVTAVLSALGLLLVACEDSTPTPEALCSRAASCEQMDVLLSPDACAQQVKGRLLNANPECANCVLSLPCSGMARVASGKVSLGQVCPACPAGVTSRSQCGPDHEHVLICGIATRPSPSASASASAAPAASAPPAKAAPSPAVNQVTNDARNQMTAPQIQIPQVPPLPTAPVPPLR